MKLFDTLSHMPFLSREALYFCTSDGRQDFVQPQLDYDRKLGLAPRVTQFQPWQITVRQGDRILRLGHELPVNSPARIFCNPVFDNGRLSFIYNRTLYTASIVAGRLTDLQPVKERVFSGFVRGGAATYTLLGCLGKDNEIHKGEDEVIKTSFKSILRVVPKGDTGLILTGSLEGEFVSVLIQDGTCSRITSNGQNVYKCHLEGDRLVYAVRESGDFEERYLYEDSYELTELPNFLQTN